MDEKKSMESNKYEKKKIWSPSAGGWTPCPSEPKLGNVTTGLQGDSLNWVGNLTVPICIWNVSFIHSLILPWKIRNEKKERPYLSYEVYFEVPFKIFSKQKTKKFPSRSAFLQVFAHWIQANEESLNENKKQKKNT